VGGKDSGKNTLCLLNKEWPYSDFIKRTLTLDKIQYFIATASKYIYSKTCLPKHKASLLPGQAQYFLMCLIAGSINDVFPESLPYHDPSQLKKTRYLVEIEAFLGVLELHVS
jgi:hypothetical protein